MDLVNIYNKLTMWYNIPINWEEVQTMLKKITFFLFLFLISNIAQAQNMNFYNNALKGAWHVEDTGIKTRYSTIEGTKPIYRQISTPPNLLYVELPRENTYLTDDMGMAAFEVDEMGNVVWERKIYGETYFGIAPLNEDEIILNILSKKKMLKIDKKSGTEVIVKEGSFRDITITDKGEILTAEAVQEGRVLLLDTNGATIWESYPIFNNPRGVYQKENGNILVVDFKHKAYEINYNTRNVIWEMSGFYYPNSIQEMKNGNYLITDEHNNRVIEVEASTQNIVRSYTEGLWSPNYARELENGDWLISDTDNHRVIQVDKNNNLVWELSNLHAPNRATR
jgi:hypothetical protein